MNKIFTLAIFFCTALSTFAQTNVGIGTNTPNTKLQVAGAISSTTSSAAAAASVVIPDNVTNFQLTAGSGPSTLTVTHPQDGQYLFIQNDDANQATFTTGTSSSVVIPAGGMASFLYLAADLKWQEIANNNTGSNAFNAGSGLGWTGNTLNSIWTLSGSNLYNNTGAYVGIGNTNPGSNLLNVSTPSASAAGSGINLAGQSSTGAAGGAVTLSAGNGAGAGNGGNISLTPGTAAGTGSAGSVAINTDPNPTPSAVLDVYSTTQGLLPPRMTTTQRNLINVTSNPSAVQGLTIFNTTTNCLESFIGTSWQPIGCGCTSAPAAPTAFLTFPTPVCQGYNSYVYSIAEIAGASTYNWTLPSGASIANGSGTSSITVNFASNAAPGTQTISVTAGNSCGTSAALSNSNLTVNQIPVITSQPVSTITICANGTPNTGNTSFGLTATGTSLTYQWQVNSGGGFTNLTNTAPYSGVTTNTLVITGATTALSGNQYQCIVSGTCTPSVTSSTTTLTVNPVPAVSTPVTAATCSGTGPNVSLTSIVPSTYAWTIGTITGQAITGASASSGNLINQTLTDPSTSATGAVPYIVTPTSTAGCVGAAATITVTVNPKPVLTITPTSATTCSGGTQSIVLTSSVTGTTYSWSSAEASNITGAGSGTGTPIAQALTNSSNSTNGTAVYTVLATTGASCTATGTSTITVNPTPSITATPVAAAICSGTATNIPLSSSAAGTTYTWAITQQTGITGATACASGCAGTIAQTLTNSSHTAAATATYTITGSASSCTATTSAVITVNPTPALTAPATAICSGGTTNVVLGSSLAGSTYTWSVAQAGTISGGSNGGGPSPIAQILSNSSNSASASATYTITGTDPVNFCTASIASVVTVNPIPVITATPAAPAICTGTAPSIALTTSVTTGTTTYSWSSTEDPNITGASTGTVSPIAQVLTNSSNAVSATATYTITGTANTCTATATAVVTVNPKPVITATPTATAMCSGSTTAIALSSSVTTGSTTYSWSVAAGTGIGGTSAGSGNTIAQLLTNSSHVTSATATYTITGTSNTCAGTVTTTVTVNPIPVITASPAAPAICSGAALNIALTSSVTTGTTSYSWSSAEASSITGAGTGSGTSITDVLSNSSNVTSATATYTITGTANTCTATVNAVVTVNPTPVVTATPSAPSVCSGTAPGIALTSSVTSGTTTYSWSSTETTGITGAGTGTGTPVAQVLNNSSNTTAGSATYTIIGTANTCTASTTAIVTVNPKPLITATPSASSICSGTAPSIALGSSLSGTTYAWSATQAATITGAGSGTGSPIAQILSNSSSTTSATATYTITGTDPVNFCSASITSVVTVTPIPVASTTSATTICSGSTTAITLTASTASTFAWSVGTINNGITGASSGSGSSIAQALTDPNITDGSVIYNVTATSTTNSCQSANYPVTVTVNATSTLGTVSNTGPIAFCDGTTAEGGNNGNWSAIPISVSGNNGVVNWQFGESNGTWITPWVSGTSPSYCCFPPKVAVSDGNPDRIRWSVTNGVCPASAVSNAILLQNAYTPAPTALTASSTSICTGSTITLTATFGFATSILGNVQFYSGGCNGTLVATVAGNGTTSVASPAITPAVGTTTYYANFVPQAGSGCSATTCASSAAVTCYAASVLGTASNPGPINYCSNTGTWSAFPVTVTGNVGTVTWYYGWSSGGWSLAWVSGTSPGYADFPPKICLSDGRADRVRWITTNGACAATSPSASILLQNYYNPDPTSVTTSASTVCSGGSVTVTANFTTLSDNQNGNGSADVDVLGSVAFYANNNCTGTALGNVTAGCDVTSVSFAAPAITAATTYSAQYMPPASVLNGVLSGSACSNGGCVASGAVSIVTGAPGTPAFTGSQSVTEGAAASTYTASATNSPTGYTWTLPANWGGSTTGSSLSLTPPAATYGIADGGNNVITVSAANVCGTTTGNYTVFVHGSQKWTTVTAATAITVPVGVNVPAGTNPLTAQLWGAGGGSTTTYAVAGGAGGYVSGTVSSTYACSGCSLYLLVGQGGQTLSSTSATGGGGVSSFPTGGACGNGGGRTAIRNSANNADLVTAGGGGGAGYYYCGSYGGAGGGATGGTGGSANYGTGGVGGSQTGGGAGGCYSGNYCGGAGGVGTQYQGGAGNATYAAGGGGGGYYGGGGGNGEGDAGGGGGSSYVTNLGGTVVNTAGNTGASCPTGVAPGYVSTGYAGSPIGYGATPNFNSANGGNGEILITW